MVAAREGVGDEVDLLVDAGQVWGSNVEAASLRIPALEAARVTWLEEPFHASAYRAYADLAALSRHVRLAGGEGAHNVHMALNLLEFSGIEFVQVDAGRIGGIGPSKLVADAALARGATYVNHTFTSHMALSASLQPYAGLASSRICEYPAEPRQLAVDITSDHLTPGDDGTIRAPDRPGLGVDVDVTRLARYEHDVQLIVDGRTLFASRRIGEQDGAGT